MRPLRGERLIHENLLFLYFSDLKDSVLAEKTKEKIAQFIDICKANDKMDGTRTVETATVLYSNGLGISVKNVKSRINMSDTSIYRFRLKMADRLKAFLMEASNDS